MFEEDEDRELATKFRKDNKFNLFITDLENEYNSLEIESESLSSEIDQNGEEIKTLNKEAQISKSKSKQNNLEKNELIEKNKLDIIVKRKEWNAAITEYSILRARYATSMHEYIVKKSDQLHADLAEIDNEQKKKKEDEEKYNIKESKELVEKHSADVETLLNEFEEYILRGE